ncbi:hypothetical protein F2Q70_00043593 [Brassica cretica]|uniref:Late embryogenesis abundant protein LEA-2 subgroup domain-containing protein n=1 Tax=Brassica cretica TaxID=69181 RepID=A0A8S9KIS7_BRACR|nr:hypothetical protein F2Q70_00043593 [Brassica cretica]
MSDHQKIHPVSDPEALPPAHPTAPLVPRGSSRSEHGDPTKESVTQPPLLDTPRRKKRGSCCCRCVCYTLLVIFLLIVIVGAAVGILYLVFRPKLPDYNIDRLQLTRFTFNQDSSLSTAFNVTITAKNPNEKIGIYYEDGSRISVLYMQTRLSNGSLPKFYQGHENTTIIFVEMTGYTRNATSLMATLQEQQRLTESIPLRIRVTQPVRIKLGKLKLMEVKFMVRCSVSVDSLAANNVIRVRSSNCKFSSCFYPAPWLVDLFLFTPWAFTLYAEPLETPYPDDMEMVFIYSVFIKGHHTYFEIDESCGGVNGTELYPDVKYMTVSEFLDTLL